LKENSVINRTTIGKGAMFAAIAAMALSGLAAPQVAIAQPGPPPPGADGPPPPPPGSYSDPCHQEQANRAVAGGVLGAVAGAVIGNNIGTGGGRTGGSIIGGVVGAAAGAKVGASTAGCVNGAPPPYPVYRDDGPPPPPPPPPPSYRRCGRAENRIYYPDGTMESYPVRACRGPDGRWFVAQ
jgi:hypothetical protein